MHPINRRDLLKHSTLAAAAFGLSPLLGRWASAASTDSGAPKKILYFTKSAGFQHSAIAKDPKDPEKLAYS